MPTSAFIAYSHDPSTRNAAHDLATRLRGDGVNVWFDRWEISLGDDWKRVITRGLEQASTVLALVDGSERPHETLHWEIEAALRSGKRVIPVLTPSADFKDIPEAIRNLQAASPFQDDTEYHQLLRQLQTERSDDEISAFQTFWKRLREYLGNE